MVKYSKCAASVFMMALCISMTSCGGKSSENTQSDTGSVNASFGVNTAQIGQGATGITGMPGGEADAENSNTDTVNSSSEAASSTGTPAIQISGLIENGHYENPLFSVYADIPDTYVIYTNEDLGQEYETQEEIVQALGEDNENFMDLVAQDSMTSDNIQIMISHISSLTEKGRTPDEWLQSSMDSFKKSLASQGATEIAAEIAPAKFAGEEVQAIDLTCIMAEKQIEQQFVYKTSGDYVMLIALSAAQGRTEVLRGFFYGG